MGALLDTENYLMTSTVLINVLGAESGEYDEVDRIINAASWAVDTYTRRNIRSRAYSGTDDECFYDGDGTIKLVLRQYPVTDVSALYVDTGRVYGSDALVDSDAYTWMQRTGIVTLDSGVFTVGVRSVKIEYTAGFTTIPWDIVQAAKDWAVFMYERQDQKRIGKKSTTAQGENISYETAVPESVKELLGPYRSRRH